MIKKKTNSLLKGVKEILSLNNNSTVENSDDIYTVGRCPKCNKVVLEIDGVYACAGKSSDTCDYMMPTMLDGEKISFDEILKFGRYQKMMKSGFLDDNTNSTNTSENNNKKQDVVDKKEVEKVEKVEIEDKKDKIEATQKTLGICPKCGGDIISNESKYSCTKCNYKLNTLFSKTKIEPSVVETLLKGEYSDWMQFTRKDGKPYKSRLMLDDKNYNYALVPYKKSSKVKEEEKINKESKDSTSLRKDGNPNSNNKKSLGKCPVCNKDIIAGKSAFGCVGLKNKSCTFKVPFKFEDMSINSKDITELLKGGTILKEESNGEEVFLKFDNEGVIERVPF